VLVLLMSYYFFLSFFRARAEHKPYITGYKRT
jgi:hypothetical protein